MKQTFVGSVLSWSAVALLTVFPVGLLWLRGAVVVATAFTALWTAHILTYAVRRARVAAAHHEETGTRISRRAFFGVGGKAAAAAALASVPVACDYLASAQIVWCDCYFDSDCGFLFYCRYDVDCTWVPKGTGDDDQYGRPPCPGDSSWGSCDGKCKFLKLPYGTVGRDTVAEAADLYFQAYQRAAEGQTTNGEPDPDLLAQAQAVSLPGDAHEQLTGAIFSALDLTTGWDFAIGFRDMDDPERPGVRGFFRGRPDGIAQIVAAAREGFVATVRTGQVDAILPPIRAFWTEFPDYHPNHGGRCYPHGHLQYPTVIGCQETNLTKLAQALNAGDQG